MACGNFELTLPLVRNILATQDITVECRSDLNHDGRYVLSVKGCSHPRQWQPVDSLVEALTKGLALREAIDSYEDMFNNWSPEEREALSEQEIVEELAEAKTIKKMQRGVHKSRQAAKLIASSWADRTEILRVLGYIGASGVG